MFSWNPSVSRPTPEILDATIGELRDSPQHPVPTAHQTAEWMARCSPLGVQKFELMTLRVWDDVERARRFLDELLCLPQLAGQKPGLVFTLAETCPWPSELVLRAQELKTPLEFRWIPRTGDAELSFCRRLRDERFEVSMVIPQAHQMDPIGLSRWVDQAGDLGIRTLELCGRQGAPWKSGIHSLLHFVEGLLGPEPQRTGIAWSSDHGFGVALAQALEAWSAGAQRIRSSLFGCGVHGNVALELLLVNLRMEGEWIHDPSASLRGLAGLCAYAEQTFDLEVAASYPVFGCAAFRTSREKDAAAILKAPSCALAELVISSVPASRVGCQLEVEVGPGSGPSNISHWLSRQKLHHDKSTIARMLQAVRPGCHVLSDLELVDFYFSPAEKVLR